MMKHYYLIILWLTTSLVFAQEFQIKSQTPMSFSGVGESLRSVWFSPDNKKVYGDFQSIYGWDVATQKLIMNQTIQGYSVMPSAVSKDRNFWIRGSSIYNDPKKKDIASMFSVLSIADFNKKNISHFPSNGLIFFEADFIPNTQQALIIVNKKIDYKTFIPSLVLFELNQQLVSLNFRKGKSSDVMTQVKISPNGQLVALSYAGLNPRVEVFDYKTRKILKTFKALSEVTDIALTNDHLVYAESSTVKNINLKTLKIVQAYPINLKYANAIALSPNGQSIAIGSHQGGCYLIDIPSSTVELFSQAKVFSLAFSPNGKMLAVGKKVNLHSAQLPSLEVWLIENSSERNIKKQKTPKKNVKNLGGTPWWEKY